MQTLLLHGSLIPVRLREKPLQLLGSRELGSHLRLGVDQSCQRFVSLTGQQQTLQILPEPFTLIALAQQRVKGLHILLQWHWRSLHFDAFCHVLPCLLCSHSTTLSPSQQTTGTGSLLIWELPRS